MKNNLVFTLDLKIDQQIVKINVQEKDSIHHLAQKLIQQVTWKTLTH